MFILIDFMGALIVFLSPCLKPAWHNQICACFMLYTIVVSCIKK